MRKDGVHALSKHTGNMHVMFTFGGDLKSERGGIQLLTSRGVIGML